jgi:predicted cation transporter
VEQYVIHWGNTPLYAVNTLSAVLDNSTMAAAEISPALPEPKFMYILFSLMVSGGMMITGNIPNIVTSGRLKIGMKEWLKTGLPVGAAILAGYLLVLGALYGF